MLTSTDGHLVLVIRSDKKEYALNDIVRLSALVKRADTPVKAAVVHFWVYRAVDNVPIHRAFATNVHGQMKANIRLGRTWPKGQYRIWAEVYTKQRESLSSKTFLTFEVH